MSYTSTHWVIGDTITAEKLNKLEQGVVDAAASGGGLFTTLTEDYDEEQSASYSRLDKTGNQILETLKTGGSVLLGISSDSDGGGDSPKSTRGVEVDYSQIIPFLGYQKEDMDSPGGGIKSSSSTTAHIFYFGGTNNIYSFGILDLNDYPVDESYFMNIIIGGDSSGSLPTNVE